MLGRHFTASGGSRCRAASSRTAGSYAAGKLMRCICAGASNGIFQCRSERPILIHEKQALRLPAGFVSCKIRARRTPQREFQFDGRTESLPVRTALAGLQTRDQRLWRGFKAGIMRNDEDIAAAAGSLGGAVGA